jgi:two-component system, cell cycle sensor histidine kinase and response regulator CckA
MFHRLPGCVSSIRNRVMLALVFAGLLPLVIFLTITQTITGRAIRQSEYAKLDEIADGVARSIGSAMDGAWSDLQNLKSNPTLNYSGDTEEAKEAAKAEFNRIVSSYGHFKDIVLYEKDTGYYVTSKRGDVVSQERDQTSWLRTASQGQITVAAPGIPDDYGQGEKIDLEVLYYIPISQSTDTPDQYVVKAVFDFSDVVWKKLEEAVFGESGYFILLDAYSNILGHPNSDLVQTKFAEGGGKETLPFFDRGEYNDDLYVSKMISTGLTRAPNPWRLLAFESLEEADALVDQSNKYLLFAGAVTLLVAIAVGMLLSNRISNPITRLSQATRTIAKGELRTNIPLEGPQEMQHLARDFNLMVGELRQHREGLESLVQERTRNLRESQEQLSDLTAQLRASYDSTQEAILVVKTDGEVLTANRRFCELFDIDSATALDSVNLQAQVEGSFLEPGRFGEHWNRCNDSLSLVEEEEWSVVKPAEKVVTIYSAPVKNASNVTFARLWMFRDLTEQRQLENGLRQAQKMEAVGRLAGGVAHDFNNLLTGIIGNLSLVQMNQAVHPEKMDHLVASAKHAGQRAAELVKQLLGFSRQSHLKLQRCKVNELAEEVKDLLIHSIDPRIQIVLDLREDLWSVSADPNQVQQVIMNMAVNAKDAIGEVKGRVRIGSANLEIDEFHASLVNDANPGDYVRISVEDTGSGMSPEVKNKIFEPFFTTKEQGKGTGLGLATSYGIIQQHGGWISCESEECVGTTFHIYIPRGDLKDFPEVMETKKEQVVGGSETVLLVDDEPVVRMVGEGVLKHHGYRVLLAGDGEEALSVIGEYGDEIGVIMLDLTMPRMSGRDTFKNLRAGDYPPIPVVVCSGYLVDLDEFAEETGAKAEGFVQKPYDSEELARTLRSVLDEAAASTASFGCR